MTSSPLPFQTEVASLMQRLRQSVQEDEILNLPLTIGQYQIKRLLGRGGMGDVYEAENFLLKRSEAIKFVRSKLTLNSEAIERFRTEIESTAQLQHPNIVTVYNAGEYEGRPYMVMELLEGQTIHQYVRDRILHKNPISIQEAIDILVQAARGLQYAHEKGFVHRDVKPGNLWITPNKTVKVLDLGLVIPTQRGTKGFHVVGTPDFMPPEQAGKGLRNLGIREPGSQGDINPGSMVPRFPSPSLSSPKSDIYSLGCTFFYILTGHVPFGGKEFSTSDKKMEAQRTCSLPPLSQYRKGVSRRIQKILNRMTAKCPEDRYTSMNEVIEVLTAKTNVKTIMGTVAGLTLLGATFLGVHYFDKQSDNRTQIVQEQNVRRPDVIVSFPIGKEAGEKRICVVDGVEYVFRWCPPGEFLMGVHGIVISEQMSIQELLMLAKKYHLLNDKELLQFQRAISKFAQQSDRSTFEFEKCQLYKKLYSQLMDNCNVTDTIPRKVTITRGFWTLDCEVTRQMWFSVMPDSSTNSQISSLNEPENAPVRNINWNDAQEFCQKLSKKLNVDVHLLTNTQWEYACRAGTEETPEIIDSQAVSFQDSFSTPAVVKSKAPNAWGIYDMPGNVWEWCADSYEPPIDSQSQAESVKQTSSISLQTEPPQDLKLLRGGCYLSSSNKESLMSTYNYENAKKRSGSLGFRICVPPK